MSIYQYELAGCMTEQAYEEAIPPQCEFQSFDAHADELMLCWGLVKAIHEGRQHRCRACPMANRSTSEL